MKRQSKWVTCSNVLSLCVALGIIAKYVTANAEDKGLLMSISLVLAIISLVCSGLYYILQFICKCKKRE